MKKFATTKNTLAIAAIVLTIAGAGVFGIANANAQVPTTTSPVSSLVQKIATKFGLNQADVQAVFDQNRTELQAIREAQYEQKLTQLVTDGKITQAQKDLILAKHKELEANRKTEMENIKTMTQEERKAVMEKKRTEMEAWAKANNIDLQYVMGMGRGRHGGRGMGPNGVPNTSPAVTATPTTQTQ